MKELVRRANRENEFVISSAAVSAEAVGCGIHSGTVRILKKHGIPFSEHRAIRLQPEDYDRYDCFALMDQRNLRWIQHIFPKDPQSKIHLLLSYAGLDREISDPWYSGNFEETYEDILLGCRALLQL